jgi:hypothetical protein
VERLGRRSPLLLISNLMQQVNFSEPAIRIPVP